MFQTVEVAGRRVMYLNSAKNDVWIRECVFPGKRGGYYVEAGAANGLVGSSCYLLERHFGWTGLCVEPNDALFAQLVKCRPHSIHENVCLTGVPREVRFITGTGPVHPFLSGDRDNLLKYKCQGQSVVEGGHEATKSGVPLAELLRKHNAPSMMEYAALDLEGSELEVLETFPFGTYTFGAITLECDSAIWDPVTRVLSAASYREVRNPFNTECAWERYWLHASIPRQLGAGQRCPG